ncbi:YbjN domain-containing protein [Parasedimentitalea denitrificans]|uniref:YbjN domain-containing protein n=1 Tax=Parasedimentitalea denitrificans TaxID=2211118 RepID=UPI001F0D7E7C|nr:YbjN domain-containing protein [Sedimentitalea sp. CY04]
MTKDSDGDPKLQVNFDGADFVVYFYGCSNKTNCDSIQFASGYKTKGRVRKAKANEWNAENRFPQAYISDNGSAQIRHYVYLGQTGVSHYDFIVLADTWVREQKNFEEFIDW